MICVQIGFKAALQLSTRIVGKADAGKDVAAGLSVRAGTSRETTATAAAAAAGETALMPRYCAWTTNPSHRRLCRFVSSTESEASCCSIQCFCGTWRGRWSESTRWFGWHTRWCAFHRTRLPRFVRRTRGSFRLPQRCTTGR